jgi:hypothetical protein
MAGSRIGLGCWLGLMTLLWSLHPLFYVQSRGVIVFVVLTAGLAFGGWLTGIHFLVVCSGGLGLVNLTAALVLTAQAPNVWLGLSAGLTLLALLDGSHRFSYLRHCQVEPGVLTAWLRVFIRVSGFSVAAGVALALLIVNLPNQGTIASAAGVLTIAGAAIFVGLVALLLLYTSRWAERG